MRYNILATVLPTHTATIWTVKLRTQPHT